MGKRIKKKVTTIKRYDEDNNLISKKVEEEEYEYEGKASNTYSLQEFWMHNASVGMPLDKTFPDRDVCCLWSDLASEVDDEIIKQSERVGSKYTTTTDLRRDELCE